MDDLAYLQDYLDRAIPLSGAMGVEVRDYDGGRLVLKAPLAANYNHQDTAFGGSLYALAALAGWGLLTLGLRRRGLQADVVIAKSEMVYHRPVEGDFLACCEAGEAEQLAPFFRRLTQRGKARIELQVALADGPEPGADFSGNFAARLRS